MVNIIDPGRLFAIAAVLVILLIIVFIILERVFSRKKDKEAEEENDPIFLENLKKVKISDKNPVLTFQEISAVTKAFFEDKIKAAHGLDYSRLAHGFSKMGREDLAQVCFVMAEAQYSGKDLDKKTLGEIKNLVERMIVNEIGESKKEKKKEIDLKAKVNRLDKFLNNLERKIKKNQISKDLKNKVHKIEQKTFERVEEKIKDLKEISHKAEKIRFKKTRLRKKEPEHHEFIQSIDALDRIKDLVKHKASSRKYSVSTIN